MYKINNITEKTKKMTKSDFSAKDTDAIWLIRLVIYF
jgi:hypothetical protein